ncbi:hypothetical protein MPC4_60040 [Methylocella tundrae]|uniref:Uncharacterized protein n=1 Tax=Methylocella tundrae TaxID=227605 RepID=A0A8B6MB47_METTU|nr:hypothetical protein MPC1_9010002 [Methylocella tundrae]VTZ51951.1 hypothetical protein MPC4_60040 [Methylocella tundrae]
MERRESGARGVTGLIRDLVSGRAAEEAGLRGFATFCQRMIADPRSAGDRRASDSTAPTTGRKKRSRPPQCENRPTPAEALAPRRCALFARSFLPAVMILQQMIPNPYNIGPL